MAIFTKAKERLDSLKEKRPWVRIVLNKYFIATVIFLLLILFNSRTSLSQMFKSMATLRKQSKQELYYRQSIKNTDERIKQLTSNKDTLEMFARENYYFLEDGEDVFIVEPAEK